MRARKVITSREALLDLAAEQWRVAAAAQIPLVGTPLGLQPSPYVKVSWRNREIGKVKSVAVKALHNGSEVFFLLEWKDLVENREITNVNVFPDGAAVLFPVKEDAPLSSMGSKLQPVTAWFWRADLAGKGKCNVAHGLGTTEVVESCPVYCRAQWSRGLWTVVIGAPMVAPKASDDLVRLDPGKEARVAFAVWEGGSGERAGLKAFSETWQSLQIEE